MILQNNKKIIITTPFFNNLGGTELETIHTANAIAANDLVKFVFLFVAFDLDITFAKEIYINPKIRIKTYPKWFKFKVLTKIQKRIRNVFKLESNPLEYLFWKFVKLKKFSGLYIITKSSQSYFVPIVQNYRNKNKIFFKFTTVLFEDIPEINKNYLRQSAATIVTSKKQQLFFKSNLKIENTIVQEVIIFNEEFALNQIKNRKKSKFDFGILARFSEEKQLEDAIDLIYELKKNGTNATLIIKGKGEDDYYKLLKEKIVEYNLSDNIILDYNEVKYDKVYPFFTEFNCFLITSKYEGGPNSALEIMAFGMPILSYKVGAMEDRLAGFPSLLADNFNDLVLKAKAILELTDCEYNLISEQLKSNYKEHFSNSKKVLFLEEKLINTPN